MKSTLLVVAAIINRGGKYLLARRRADCASAPGKWEFPGGKVEFGEHPEAALIREIREELGIGIGNLRVFCVTSSMNPPGSRYRHIVIISYLADWIRGKMRITGCQDAKLVPLRMVGGFDLIEADSGIARLLSRKRLPRK